MAKKEIYQFYVEGEDEKKVIEVLKKDMKVIVSGKVDVLNVVQQEIKLPRIRTLKAGTIVILVYDTDVEKVDLLERNIQRLNSSKHIKRVVCVPQVGNLEDELVRATNVRQVIDLLSSETLTDFKRDLIRCTNLDKKLLDSGFDISKLWCMIPDNKFSAYGNSSKLIKKK